MEIMRRGCLVIIDSFASDGICYGLVGASRMQMGLSIMER